MATEIESQLEAVLADRISELEAELDELRASIIARERDNARTVRRADGAAEEAQRLYRVLAAIKETIRVYEEEG